ncbi:MAG: hypothetical protein J3Q66DRAFT_24422 [Benniella sp.]|nr:MAG: hypothetical protein J3Q66DRAFT_24422 [Benniella sp.]
MKFSAVLAVTLSGIATTSAHVLMSYPSPRGSYGTLLDRNKDFAKGEKKIKGLFNGNIQSFINHYDDRNNVHVNFPCGGYPYKYPKGWKPTPMKAGEIINVRFLTTKVIEELNKKRKGNNKINGGYEGKMPEPSRGSKNNILPDKKPGNPRHGGGECEFHISYDGGKTLNTIGRYTKTCPSVYDDWPVKIPDYAKECTKKDGTCLFVWTWLAHTLPQWYMNCADISLTNTKVSRSKQRKPPTMDVEKRLNRLKHPRLISTAPGENKAKKYDDVYEDSGPNPKELRDNRNGILPKTSIKTIKLGKKEEEED